MDDTSVEIISSYDKRPTLFDVEGLDKYEKRDAKGKLVAGNAHRWVDLKNDRFNFSEKKRVGRWEPALYDDIKVPFAEGRKKGEPWIIKNGPEEMMLMKRSVEENDRDLERNRQLMAGTIRENSTFRGSRNITSQYQFQKLSKSEPPRWKRTGF